jgi:hypothetical protein
MQGSTQAEVDATIQTLTEFNETIQSADAIGETKLSGVFHKARTTRKGKWTTVSAFCKIEDGEVVVKEVSGLRDGRWSPDKRSRYDLVIHVNVRPFMSTREFKRCVDDRINGKLQALQTTKMNIRDRERREEYHAD